MRLARVSVRVLRKLSACALPRPSATASAKFANSTVNHSHRTIWKVNPTPALCCTRSRTSKTVVSAVTTSSTKITGFLIRVAGLSLTKAWPIAGSTIFGSKSVETGIRLRSLEVSIAVTPNESVLEQRARGHREVLDDGPERERGEEGEAANDHDHAHDQPDEQAAGGRERASGRGDTLFLGERAGDRHGRDDHEEATDKHRDRAGDVEEHRVGRDAGEGRSVIAGARRVQIEHLRKPVRTRIAGMGP